MQALQLGERATQTPQARIVDFLAGRRLLLILDNFEHLLPAATRVAGLLTTCPGLRVLVTSREPLNLRLEQRLLLEGLALPDLIRPTAAALAVLLRALALGLALRTVKTHVTSAMNKLGVDNRAHAAVVAIRRGLR